ncbi:protein NATD1 [Puntigrus tetrazona]|uniref:protein NATD1 n=1 Tax=Puntigrus tetrazona TaxID=1606681 RepID=UPI001C89BF4F|nr:protein NATD1 [Puntigrus tetrazona]
MARYIRRFSQGYKNNQRLSRYTFRGCTSFSNTNVIHDRQNRRFTVTLDCDGAESSAELKYAVRDDRVELISTEVPETHRGKGVAAHLAKVKSIFSFLWCLGS